MGLERRLFLFLTLIVLASAQAATAQIQQRCVILIDRFEDTTELPQFRPVFDQVATVDGLISFDIDTQRPSEQTGLSFALARGPEGMSIDAATGLVSWQPDVLQTGVFSATVVVSDAQRRRNRHTFCIEVIDPSAAPRISPIADTSVLVDENFSLTVQANDADPGDVITFSLDQAPLGMSIDSSTGLIEWRPGTEDTGPSTVVIRATDRTAQFDLESFEVTVVESNQPPMIAPVADLGARPGVDVALPIDASDPDGDDLVFSLLERPAGMVIEPASGLISWLPVTQQLGRHPVSVRVTDPLGFADQTEFAIQVDFNRAPVAVDDDGYRVERGDTLSLPAPGVLDNDTDPNNDALSAQRISDPVRGTLTLNADGGFDYTPDNPAGTIGFASEWSYVVPNGNNAWLPIVADLDDDPQSEVLIARGQGNSLNIRVTALDGLTGQIDWQVLFRDRELSTNPPPPVVADIDLDGMPELLILGGEPDASPTAVVKIYAFEHNGTLKWISDELPLQFYLDGARRSGLLMGRAALTVADLDGDGLPEILAAPSNGPVGYHVWDHEGRTLQTVQAQGTQIQTNATRVTVVDLDLDGTPEIVVGNVAWSNSGQELWRKIGDSSTGRNFRHIQASDFPLVANLDDDPFPELVRTRGSFSGPANLVAWNHDGTDMMTPAGVPWEFARPSGFNTAPISIADVDGDGDADVLLPWRSESDQFDVLDGRDGSVKWSKAVPTRSSGATVFDMDRDGFPEVVFFDAVSDLHVWDGRDGTERLVFDADGGATMPPDFTLPVFADIDADGQAELLTSMGFTFGNTPAISVWKSPADDWAPGRSIWNEHRYRVTNINEDLSVPKRERPHWLLPGLNQAMVNGRLPETRIEEQDSFTYRASDGELASNTATVSLSILPPNAAPRILSTPPPLASPGFEYVYTVLAVDADPGEVLTFAIAEGPTGMAIDGSGRLSWTPSTADLGPQTVVLSVSDSLGVTANQSFILEVTEPVTVPDLQGLDEAAAVASLEAVSLRADPLRDVFNDSVAAGQVADQDPPAGSLAAAGSGVEVEVSRGPVPLPVPRVLGLKLDDAQAELASAGLSTGSVVWVNDPLIPRGTVAAQDPPPNASASPGSTVDLTLSGGPRASLIVDPPVITAGSSAEISVEIRDTDGTPLAPQPTFSLSLGGDPASGFGTPPSLSGNTLLTSPDTQGAFELIVSYAAPDAESIGTEFAVLGPISDGIHGDLYSRFSRQQQQFGTLIEQLITAVDQGNSAAIAALDADLAELAEAIDLRRLRTMTAVAPEDGALPSPAQAAGLGSSSDDGAYLDTSLELIALLETLDALARDATTPDRVLNQLNQDLAATAAALAALEPSVPGILQANGAITALTGTLAPSLLVADIQAVRQALADQGLLPGQAGTRVGRFSLPGIMVASQIRQSIITDFYVPYLGQAARMLGAVIAADALQTYANFGAISGIITGASQSIHVFGIQPSVIEGLGFDPTLSPNNAVIMVGPALLEAVSDAASALSSARSVKDVNSAFDAINGILDAADGLDDAWSDANSIPVGVVRGCILDNSPACSQLVYPDGFTSVYKKEGGLSLPGPVLIITRNLVSAGSAVFVANFVPTTE
ncbi:MAG: putative Ig domain-containing protein [Wenzhouxiangella sp.]|jgi:outer membrane protein assembly factor BamB|nr:putative Ig domain-containing protein [Wenzhouxiangella sp.]